MRGPPSLKGPARAGGAAPGQMQAVLINQHLTPSADLAQEFDAAALLARGCVR